MTHQPKSINSTATSIGILLILVSFAAIILFQVPALKTARVAKAEQEAIHNSKLVEINKLTAAQASLSAKENQLRSLGVNPETLALVIPTQEDVPSLYLQMESQLKNVGNLQGVKYQIGKPVIDPVDGLAKIPLTLSASGGYAQLKVLIKNLENNIRPVSFTTISFGQTDAALTLSATGYFRSLSISGGASTPSN